jgi:hypothetical protein
VSIGDSFEVNSIGSELPLLPFILWQLLQLNVFFSEFFLKLILFLDVFNVLIYLIKEWCKWLNDFSWPHVPQEQTSIRRHHHN